MISFITTLLLVIAAGTVINFVLISMTPTKLIVNNPIKYLFGRAIMDALYVSMFCGLMQYTTLTTLISVLIVSVLTLSVYITLHIVGKNLVQQTVEKDLAIHSVINKLFSKNKKAV